MTTSSSKFEILDTGYAKYKVFDNGDVYVQPFEYTYVRKDTGKTYTRMSRSKEAKLVPKMSHSNLFVWLKQTSVPGKYESFKLASVVWAAFNHESLESCEKYQIEFKDSDSSNCALENLYRPYLSLNGETWKDIHEYDDLYQVSNLGRIRRKPFVDASGNSRSEHVYAFGKLDTGYLLASFDYCLPNKQAVHDVKLAHRVVAEYFCENPHNKPEVNHIDGNKSNNKASNLEWVTRSENEIHAYKTGLAKPSRR